MTKILKFVYIMLLYVSLLLIVDAGGRKFIFIFLSYVQSFNHF